MLRAGSSVFALALRRRAYSVTSAACAAAAGAGGIPGGRPAPPRPGAASPAGAAAPPRPQGIIGADGSVVRAGAGSSSNSGPAAPVDKVKAAKDRRDRHAALMQAAAAPPPEMIVDVTPANFAKEVLDSPVPVILDCWAAWCGPCKQLTPMLEQIVMQSRGLFKLAMLDADAEENQPLAAQLNVRSLPTVFGVVKGKVVDSFMGLQNAQRMQQFFGALANAAQQAGVVPSPAGDPATAAVTTITEASAAVDEGDASFALEVLPSTIEAIQQLYTAIHRKLKEEAMGKAAAEKTEPMPVRSDIGPLADVDTLLARGYAVMVRALLAEAQRGITSSAAASSAADALPPPILPPDQCFKQAHSFYEMLISPRFKTHQKDELVARGVSAGSLAKNAEEAVSKLTPLLSAHQANPSDPEARFALAEALASSGNSEAAMEHLLALVKSHPAWREGAAKATLLKLLDALGASNPVAVKGRKALSKLLFR